MENWVTLPINYAKFQTNLTGNNEMNRMYFCNSKKEGIPYHGEGIPSIIIMDFLALFVAENLNLSGLIWPV